MLKHLQKCFANVLQHFILRQLHKVNGGENVFVRYVCLCVCVCGQSDQFKTVKAFDMHVPRYSSDTTTTP